MNTTNQTVYQIKNRILAAAAQAIKKDRSSSQPQNRFWIFSEDGNSWAPFRVHFAPPSASECFLSFETIDEIKWALPEGHRLIKVTLEEVK